MPSTPPQLIETDQGLALDVGDGHPVRIDLVKLDTTSGPGRRLTTPLLKAIGIRKGNPHRPRVVDATAGFGEDTWLLASAGCRVLAIERQPIVATLLRDALNRAATVQPHVAERIDLWQGDAATWLRNAARSGAAESHPRPDVVYLDPMFPAGRKTAERKPMKVLRAMSGDDADADTLLAAALAVGARRVVVKRPTKAPPLGDRPATVSHHGRAVRFDVYAAGSADRAAV